MHPFILITDVSFDRLGSTLYQKQMDGIEKPVAYASRGLSDPELRYDTHKLEFLALKWSVTDQFHEYLYGGAEFEVHTDNNPLTYILMTAKLDATGQWWIAALGAYNFSLHYIKGKENVVADALSRIPTRPEPEVVIDKERVKKLLSVAKIPVDKRAEVDHPALQAKGDTRTPT